MCRERDRGPLKNRGVFCGGWVTRVGCRVWRLMDTLEEGVWVERVLAGVKQNE